MSLDRVPELSGTIMTAQGHDTIVPEISDTIRVPKGHDRDTIRDTKIRVVSLNRVQKSRDTIFLKFVSLSFAQGHDSGTRHDRVPDKSMPESEEGGNTTVSINRRLRC